jgi:hypothetical protein
VRIRRSVEITDFHKQLVTRLMEYSLVGMLFIGLERGGTGIVVNCVVGIVVIQIPPLLKRDYDITLAPGLLLWITTAVFLHALGTVGIPGSGIGFYKNVWWYDHLTHALSASVVTAVGYTFVRVVDEYSDSVSLPPKFVFVFILSFTIAFGVVWEVVEFAIGQYGVLTQYGLEDTMLDLVFDVAGGVIVAVWGTAYLGDFAGSVVDRLKVRSAD